MEKGYPFGKDTVWQKQFEDSFPYEETQDQLGAAEEIKSDMEKPFPMDRLLCGDVGFGKTEVAARAIFKCIDCGKQAAVLVPTTILANQHFYTLKERFAGFPFNIEMLSRFRSEAQQKEIEEKLKNGEIDLIIGTHRLLGKNVQFKDLGLLVVDEEQRFGVEHKEQIKKLKKNVDVLTLSATPIPRTLNMSLTGIKDMSLIEEPPEERYPVQTYVMEQDDSLIRDIIEREMGRGGQVYVVFNRVKGIHQIADRIQQLVPEARIAVGHGQMNESLLEDTMIGFINGEQDVLISTTIIESGIDIPNANTMIIMDADRYGLSQLYQLRGRVGRSNRQAYAYLMYQRDKVLTETAEKRLRAIRDSQNSAPDSK
ncbi:MAG: DEAD/DEAH box helicase [Anaerovoracaceae bacterium]